MTFYGDIAGFLGSLIILAGFARVNVLKRMPDALFNLLNLMGAGLLAVSLSINYNLPALLLEIAWMGIALYGLFTVLREKAPSRQAAKGKPLPGAGRGPDPSK